MRKGGRETDRERKAVFQKAVMKRNIFFRNSEYLARAAEWG